MNADIKQYINSQPEGSKEVCEYLQTEISERLPEAENKVWHAHPVWFIDGNPIVGYSKLKDGVRLMFWSGADFNEPELRPGTGKFKDASITYTSVSEIDLTNVVRWLEKAKMIQWDYKNIVKRKGVLKRIDADAK